MSKGLAALRLKRSFVPQDLQAIDHMRRGSLSKQFFKAASGQSGRRGPYFVLQGFFQGKKFKERIPAEEAPQVQEQVVNYRRLCKSKPLKKVHCAEIPIKHGCLNSNERSMQSEGNPSLFAIFAERP